MGQESRMETTEVEGNKGGWGKEKKGENINKNKLGIKCHNETHSFVRCFKNKNWIYWGWDDSSVYKVLVCRASMKICVQVPRAQVN